jgi:penicillin-binding protein 1A
MTDPHGIDRHATRSSGSASRAGPGPRFAIMPGARRLAAWLAARWRFVIMPGARRLVAWLAATRRRRATLLGAVILPVAMIVFTMAWLTYHVYFDRTGVPNLESFLRFEPPTTGVVRDVRGTVMIELAREYRRIVTYDEIPVVLRQAILAAEDKRFFSHSGVDYHALPRVIQKTVVRSCSEWWKGGGARLLLPQGGSTLTQQLVRGYFLVDLTNRTERDAVFHAGLAPPRLLSLVLGASAMNKLLRKMEEVRLTLWLEREMRTRFGSQELAKREIFARYASFIYLGNGRYGFAAASEYYFGKPLSSYTSADAGNAALLAAISKAPRDYAPVPGNRRLIARRNQILALMANYGYIPVRVATRCEGEPIRVAAVSPLKTDAPAAIDHVLGELTERGGTRFGVEDLFQGRVVVRSTVDTRVQAIVNDALEHGLALYERRHPAAKGLIQGSVVVLGNADASILAEAGGRRIYRDRDSRYSDYNRVTNSLRQPGSAMKPLVYLAAFESGLDLATTVPDEPIEVPIGNGGGFKQIANYDNQFKGPIPVRQALAESRNAVAVWITREIGVATVIRTAHRMGIRSPLQPYLSTALGASEVRLLELADAYRAIASGLLAEPHIIDFVSGPSGDRLYEGPRGARAIQSAALRSIQEGLRGVVRLPDGTAHSLDAWDFPIPVMGKTGTTSDFRDALFVGSTYGAEGITVAVRIGFDDSHPLGGSETGGRTALPIFREIMLRVYRDKLVGRAPTFPRDIEDGIDQYLAGQAVVEEGGAEPGPRIQVPHTGPADAPDRSVPKRTDTRR